MAEQGGTKPPPQIAGRYEILREIGRGGMAVVYAARQPDLDRLVALKELSRFHAGSPEFAHRFLRESRLAGSLNHPNVVTVHEYFEHQATPYIAMEYVPRGSLRPYMKGLSLIQIGGVLEGVLAGLSHAENAGIVHRDLKPENIMVTADGRVKITDFGIARATQRAGTQYMTATGMTVGTPTYMAPEQAMASDIGPWTDLYSVGVLTYELVVGHVPFHDTDAPMVMLMRHVNERIPSPIEVRPDIDPGLSQWIDSLLVKNPEGRVRHAATAWESLEDIIVRLIGPLWRRDARLLEDHIAFSGARPLTPAPFDSEAALRTPTPHPSAVPDAFITFDPRSPPAPAPPPKAPTPKPPEAAAPEAPEAAAPEAVAPEVAEVAPEALETPTPVPAVEPADAQPVDAGGASTRTPAAPTDVQKTGEDGADEERAPVEPEFVTYGRRPVPRVDVSPPPPAPPPPPASPPAEELAPELPPLASEPSVPTPVESEPVLPPEPTVEQAPAPPPEPPPEAVPSAPPLAATAPPRSAATRPRGARKAPAAAVVAVAAVAAAVVGFVIAHGSGGGGSPATVAFKQQASAGPLRINYPTGWQQVAGSGSPGASGLHLANAVTLKPGAAARGGALVLGTAKTADATLLPSSFKALVTAPQGATVQLGSHTFKRYLDLQPHGAGTQESVYALPTSLGTAIAVCVVPQSNATDFAATCERSVSSLTTSGTVLSLTASPSYAGALGSIVSKLNAARSADGTQLAGAKTSSGQAAAARALAQANGQAATAAAKLSPGTIVAAANAAIVAALRQLAAGYQSLSGAAAHNNKHAYGAAQTSISHADAALSSAFAQLRQNGYTVG